MSIRLKLLLSNIVMIAIPLVSAVLLAIILISIGFASTDSNNNKSEDNSDKIVQDIFKEFITISNDALNYPDKFKNIKYLENIDNNLKKINSAFVFTLKSKIYYHSSIIDSEKFEEHLRLSDSAKGKDFKSNHSFGKMEYLNYDFSMTGGENCSLYIFFDTSPVKEFIHNFVSNFIKWFLIIVLVTNGLLTFLVSKSIIRPLKKLKYGAEQIKNGNLSFEIKDKSRDEVGDVCHAFEEMRQRLKEALEQQLKYEEERNEFLASITHDLKTPIASIKGHIDGIKDGIADNEEKRDKYIDIIYKKAIDIDKLINDLTFYSNQTLKKVPFNFSRVNLNSFIEDLLDEYQMEMEKIGISIMGSFNADKNILVKADVEKLKRVVANLLENSVKYMNKEKGEIKIEVNDKDDRIIIGILDNGEGIKGEHIQNIFNRFYRADPSRNTSKGGSGLGLAIASQIIEEHGGRIWAESRYGEGTAIYFELEKAGENNEKKDSNN